ncbi:RNA-binding protein 43-like [Pristis pectinata]|uniref:RNA-binding protein 43-like n=1 Tax=Pristis pectinata TaxID=685728 RepID=UPI00223E8954|nr:RNA-binding protein 43-like [Pristis pectinata]
MKRHEDTLGAGCSTQQPDVKLQCPKKIQVLNVPTIISAQRTVDKLKIHFQTQSNGGGEVLDVEYPTSVKGCAFITFVTDKDANNVLKCEQILKFDKKEYKLEVCEAGRGESTTDDVQVMQFVSTKLDTSHFSTDLAQDLILKHGLEIVNYQGSIVEIKGSFSSLKELRRNLMNVTFHQLPCAVTESEQLTNN